MCSHTKTNRRKTDEPSCCGGGRVPKHPMLLEISNNLYIEARARYSPAVPPCFFGLARAAPGRSVGFQLSI